MAASSMQRRVKVASAACSVLLATSSCLLSNIAAAIPIENGSFESGLIGWDSIGDVSVQSAELGVAPTDGQFAAVLTTLGAPYKPNTYAGSAAVSPFDMFLWLGLPEATLAEILTVPFEVVGGGGLSGTRTSFTMQAGQALTFDWNRAGDYIDASYVLFYRTGDDFRSASYLELKSPFAYPTQLNLGLKDTEFCGNWIPQNCAFETGWQSTTLISPTTGDYTVVFGMFERMDIGWASTLWLDNFRVHPVPEPSTLLLLSGGLLVIAFAGRRRFGNRGATRRADAPGGAAAAGRGHSPTSASDAAESAGARDP